MLNVNIEEMSEPAAAHYRAEALKDAGAAPARRDPARAASGAVGRTTAPTGTGLFAPGAPTGGARSIAVPAPSSAPASPARPAVTPNRPADRAALPAARPSGS